MHTPDMTQDNIARIRELFPNCVTEAKDKDGNLSLAVDFDALRQELSNSIVEGERERYRLDWPGKKEAMLAANAPIATTLRPCREESVDFDTTQNLFIESDNLDALKLLQESYLGKVKMIYIDPPYNTGKDFVYEDDFAETAEEYLERSNQKGENGRLVANTESNGRFHSDWLSMMYPRLKLARNLLTDDGVIFISIDDNEVENLKKVCSEIFGEDNFLFLVTLLCNPKGRSQDKFVATCHEYILGYSKYPLQKGELNIRKNNDEILNDYKNCDSIGRYRNIELRNTHREFGKHNRKNLYYPFFIDKNGHIYLEQKDNLTPVYPIWDDGFEGCWTWSKDKAKESLNLLVCNKVKNVWKIYRKDYADKNGSETTKQLKSIFIDKYFYTEKGQAEFNSLFKTKEKLFQSPKSVNLLSVLLEMGSKKDSLILDFFAGSSTTAHAVMQLNAEDGGNRRFIMVQLPEVCDEKSEAAKAGYKTIAEISKERIRRAGKRIKEELAEKQNPSDNIQMSLLDAVKPAASSLDTGFRVLKVDSSNMNNVFYNPDAVTQKTLMEAVSSIKYDRSDEDLLFQVLLDWGVDLSLPIHREKRQGKTVFFVDENALVACFDKNITEELVQELARLQPLRVVFRDDGFVSDAVKINVDQIFRQLSPGTLVKSL